MKLRNPEDNIQQALCQWLTLNGIAFFSIPNGYAKSKFMQAQAKATGLRKGVPDLCICEPSGDYHGLFIELKAGRNKPTAEQLAWIELLKGKGYSADVCYSLDSAIETVEKYLKKL